MDIRQASTCCTVGTFSEIEKMEAAHSVLSKVITFQKSDITPSESYRKDLLHDLAAMNSMVPKGYRVNKSPADTLIYSVKQIACEAIAREWPDRCRYMPYGSIHGTILYVYAGGRQYSFHVHLDDFNLPKASFDEWDQIKNGWSLPDEEYALECRSRANERRSADYWSHDILVVNRREREERLKMYKAAKEYVRNLHEHQRLRERFWNTLLSILPPAKRKNKCVANRDLQDCLNRYKDLVKGAFSEEEMRFLRYGLFWGDYWDYSYHCSETTREKLYAIVDAIQENNLTLKLFGSSIWDS